MNIGFAGNYGNSPINAVVFRTTFKPVSHFPGLRPPGNPSHMRR